MPLAGGGPGGRRPGRPAPPLARAPRSAPPTGRGTPERNAGLHLHGRCGFGDNIYWRPLVRAAAAVGSVWVETPYPELFRDLGPNVHCVQPYTKLRTQMKNIRRHVPAGSFENLPRGARSCGLKYGWKELEGGTNLFRAMEQLLPVPPLEPFVFDLPDFGPPPVATTKPIAVVRPVTERTEWLNQARNPRPEYVTEATAMLRARGYYVVVVADLQDGHEWALEPLPVGDENYLRGELKVGPLLSLVQHAAVVVGGVGWVAPAAVAARAPLILIAGGQGAHNAPSAIFDDRMDTSRVRWVFPDRYCRCGNMTHDCDKEIGDFARRFSATLDELVRRRRRRKAAA